MNKLYIIAGPNGAGKTTASMEYLKHELECLEFLNADNIALGLSPFQPEKVAVSAGKIMLERIDELIRNKVDFAIETTLASKTLKSKLEFAKNHQYEIYLLFFYLEDPELALNRVKTRVEKGGHHIPNDIIIRRYHRGLINFFNIFRDLSDYWLLINNSGLIPEIIIEGSKSKIQINNQILWNSIEVEYGKEISNN